MPRYVPAKPPAGLAGRIGQYLANEFKDISNAFRGLVTARFGGMNQNSTALSLTSTPQKLPFANAMPSRLIDADLTLDRLTVIKGGVYDIELTSNAAASNSVVITYTIYVNGVATSLTAQSEVIQQATAESFSARALLTLNDLDYVEVFVSGAPNRTVTFANANLVLTGQ